MKKRIIFLILLLLIDGYSLHADTKPYWIFFRDRGSLNIENAVAAKIASPEEPKNMSRRARILKSKSLFDEKDIEVNPEYIRAVSEISGGIRTITRFLNGVSVNLDSETLEKIEKLPFVQQIKPVSVFRKSPDPEQSGLMKPGVKEKNDGFKFSDYGDSFEQLNLIGIPQLHQLGYAGNGITVAILDSGFDGLQHTAFDSTQISHKWDFIEGDGDPAGDNHGTEVLSVIAALDRGNMIGTAPYATFILARTENVIGNVEQRIEEDYWVAGIEWADSLGADIANSSLGYTIFDDGAGYTYNDLDGDTAVTTIAADAAAAKGMIVVVSAGNEGNKSWYYITTPADGDSVFAVGSVDLDRNVSSFSSRGPTFDGRIKPDFVTLGEQVHVVDTIRTDAYRYAFGTSYSAPSFSGAVALILEVNPTWDFGTLRSALIASAQRAAPDSLYGYGMIDAFSTSGLKPTEPSISEFRVYDPYPQPVIFNDTTRRIYFPVEIPVENRTLTIRIFNFSGENIQTLEAPISGMGSLRNPGDAPSWDGTNFSGENVAPGIYYYSIQLFGYERHTGKIMVMR